MAIRWWLNKSLVHGAAAAAIAAAALAAPLAAAPAAPSLRREGKTSGIMVSSLAFSPDGRVLAAGGGEGSVDPEAGSVSLSPSGAIVLVDAERMKAGKRVASGSWPGHLVFAADGAELIGLIDNELRRWRAKDGRQLATLAKGVDDVAYAVDGSRAVVELAAGGFTVLELPTGSTLATHPPVPEGDEGKLLVTASGPMLAFPKDGELRLRALGSADTVSGGAWSEGGITAVAVGPDGKTVAFGTDSGAVVLVDVATGQRLKANTRGKARVNAIAFAPDGSAVVYGGVGAAVSLWSVNSDEVQISFGRHRFPILAVAFAADSRRIASSSFDGTIKLWEVELRAKPH